MEIDLFIGEQAVLVVLFYDVVSVHVKCCHNHEQLKYNNGILKGHNIYGIQVLRCLDI